jgi:flagellar basal-body rod protein FlgF
VKPNPSELQKDSYGLLRSRSSQPFPADASVRLVSGSLESSNVNTAEALVNMIDLARQFELQIKMMRTAEDNAEATNQLLRME